MNRRYASLDKRTTPFPFQSEAIDAARELSYAAIFFEQGLGKTKIAIDLILDWLNSGAVDTVIVITLKSLIKNWLDEFNIHSHLKPRVLSSDRAANHRAFFSKARVYLANYEVIALESEHIELFSKRRTIAAVLDESQKIKNPESALTQSFFELSPTFSKRLIMTGTPMANRPHDIWSQVFFLDSGASLGFDFEVFKRKLDIPSRTTAISSSSEIASSEEKVVNHGDSYAQELSSVFPKIDLFAFRETKEGSGLELPGKVYSTEISEWEQQQRTMYEKMRNELRLPVERAGALVTDDAEYLLKRLLRLVQIASNPILVDESYDQRPGKVATLQRLLSGILSKGEKAIVWTSFVKNCQYLRDHLEGSELSLDQGLRPGEHQVVQVHGQMSITERNDAIDQFKSDANTAVLVANPAAAKEGLTLTVANHAIFFDRSFSLDSYVQAQDRIHRISQNNTCYIYNIVLPNSIDEWISALISLKSSAARVGMGDVDAKELEEVLETNLDEILKEILEG